MELELGGELGPDVEMELGMDLEWGDGAGNELDHLSLVSKVVAKASGLVHTRERSCVPLSQALNVRNAQQPTAIVLVFYNSFRTFRLESLGFHNAKLNFRCSNADPAA